MRGWLASLSKSSVLPVSGHTVHSTTLVGLVGSEAGESLLEEGVTLEPDLNSGFRAWLSLSHQCHRQNTMQIPQPSISPALKW